MTRKRKQKEETRWCILYPDGQMHDASVAHSHWLAKLRFNAHSDYPYKWKFLHDKGYKCVKIKIRRAK